MKKIAENDFADIFIGWYLANKRDLPWRNTKDPYKIWLSEIILQQTRVAQGLPYYEAFVEKFPSIDKLATADENEVLRLWQGLGYYSRARNLHACAKHIHHELKNNFPENYQELIKLKGVGPYTAAAIASFAFKEPVAVVDGNVMRVIARFFGIYDDIAENSTQTTIREICKRLISTEHPDLFNQAIMEFGALHCKPNQPLCGICPFAGGCFAYENLAQKELPVKRNKVKVKNRYFHYFIWQKGSHIYMNKRPKGDIWEGLYDLPMIEANNRMDLESLKNYANNSDLFKNSIIFKSEMPEVKHVLSHQVIYAKFFLVDIENEETLLKEPLGDAGFFSTDEIESLPKPVLIKNFLNQFLT
ncbi:A/G-specific adenine glycosylase [Peijinzhouia sedimentorum]